MIRTAVLSAALLTLMACAERSSLPAVDQPAPLRPDPLVCAAVPKRPELPKSASVVQPDPATAEASATAAFLNWISDLVAWGDGLAHRAEVARKAC